MTDAQVTYCPGSVVTMAATTTGYTALDPALAVTIVAPASGSVEVELDAMASLDTVAAARMTPASRTLVAVTAAEATVTASSGGHTDASQCADVAGAVAFVDRCTA